MGYDWNFSAFVPYAGAFLRGTWLTLALAGISSVLGTILGFVLAFPLRLQIVGPMLGWVNDALRAVPLLVLLFFFYYFPYEQLLGIRSPSPFVAAIAALTMAQANFTAEIVRTAIDAVSARKISAAKALGLKDPIIWLYVTLPDVVRQIIPTMMAFYIGNLKLSSLASIIGAEDVVYVARISVSQTYRSLEAWVIVGLIYIAVVLPFTILARQVETSEWIRRR